MGTRLIFRYSDFSANAIRQEPSYTTESFGTSDALWSYATTKASGGYFGFVVSKDYIVTGVTLDSAQAAAGAMVGVFEQGNNTSIVNVQTFDVTNGLQTIIFEKPITVKAGQCIAVRDTNVYFCEPNIQPGDYPTNSYDGVFMTAPFRCFRMNFFGYATS